MIRRVNYDSYFLGSKATPANFGGWDAGVFRPHRVAGQHRKAMDVFKRSTPEVPLNPIRTRKTGLRWNDDGAA